MTTQEIREAAANGFLSTYTNAVDTCREKRQPTAEWREYYSHDLAFEMATTEHWPQGDWQLLEHWRVTSQVHESLEKLEATVGGLS